jgi:phage tail-like protein
MRSFRFRVSLLRSPEAGAANSGAAPVASGGFSAGASASLSLSASASFGASASGGLSAGAIAGLSASAGLSAGASLSAGIGTSASLSLGAGGGDGMHLGDGGFAECTGLEVEMDVQELLEGGRNDGVIRRVGRGKYQNIVLKRGMLFAPGDTANDELWRWLQDVLAGVRPVARHDGIVEVLDVDDVVASWAFRRGLPQKISGPQLNARTGEVAIEELHIAHEGLTLVTT